MRAEHTYSIHLRVLIIANPAHSIVVGLRHRRQLSLNTFRSKRKQKKEFKINTEQKKDRDKE